MYIQIFFVSVFELNNTIRSINRSKILYLFYSNRIQNYSKSIQMMSWVCSFFALRTVGKKICVWQSIGFVQEAELMKRFQYRWHLTWSIYERKIWIGKTDVCVYVRVLAYVGLCVSVFAVCSFWLYLSLSVIYTHTVTRSVTSYT